MTFYSAIKKNKILTFAATWMEPENIILSEKCQTEEKANIIWYTYVWNLKIIQINLYTI